MTRTEATTIDVPEQSAKAGLVAVPGHDKTKKGLAILDLILRIGAMVSTLAAASTMGTSEQSLQLVSQFFQFEAAYDDFPTFQFFLVAMALVTAYLLLSMPLSVVSIVRPHVTGPRMLLLIMDIGALTFTTSAASAGAAIVYLAHNGNGTVNWRAICFQFGDFCASVSGAVVAGFGAVVTLALLSVVSGLSLRRN